MARRRLGLRRPRVASVVTAQAVLGVIIAAVATLSVAGYVVAGTAFVIGVALAVHRRGRSLLDVVRDRLRDAPDDSTDPGPDPDGAIRDLGAPRRLLTRLHVVDVETRRSGRIGVVGDGQGFVVVLDVLTSASTGWEFADVVAQVFDDPARPASVQLLVEQRSSRRTTGEGPFAPGRTYRSLPTDGIPLWNRAVVTVRHEPSWAPETVVARGGGAAGARAAITAATARLVASSRARGICLRPLAAPAVAALFRDLGDPGPDCEERDEAWTTSTACHAVVSVSVTGPDALGRLLEATAELDVDRSVVSLAISAVDHTVCGTLRLVAPDLDHVESAVATLVERGLARPVPRAQGPGVVATLPLGGGARSLAELVNQVRM